MINNNSVSDPLEYRKQSISTRLSRYVIITAISSLVFIGSGLIIITSITLKSNTTSLHKKNAETVAMTISEYLDIAVNDLSIAEMFFISGPYDIRLKKKILEQLITRKNSIFSRISLIDSSGNKKLNVSKYHSHLENEDYNRNTVCSLLAAKSGETYISPVYISQESGLLSVSIAIPLKENNMMNTLAAEINITELWQDISQIRIGNTGYAYIVDKSGNLTTMYNPFGIQQRQDPEIKNKPPVEAFISGQKYNDPGIYHGLNNNMVIGVSARVEHTPWAVILELPATEMFTGIRHMIFFFTVLFFAGTIISGTAVFFVTRRIVRQVNIPATDSIGMAYTGIQVAPGSDEVTVFRRDIKQSHPDLNRLLKELEMSETKYRTIFENSGSALALVGENNMVDMVNRELEVMTGYSRYEIEGIKTWMDFIAKESDLERMHTYMKKRLSGSDSIPGTYEFHLIGRDGRIIEVILSTVILPGTRYILATMVDITKFKKAEFALSQSELRFRAIFNNSYHLIILLNVSGTILDVNKTALDFIRVREEDVVGRSAWETDLWSHSDETREKMRRSINVASFGTLVRYETTTRDADMNIHDIDFSIKPVFDGKKVALLIFEARDITDRCKAEAEKFKLEEQLRQAQKMESIGRLAGGIAHDFNNVLGGIAGTVSLFRHRLEKGIFEKDYAVQMVTTIETAASRAAGIVNQILSLSRKKDMLLSDIDMNTCVKNVVSLCRVSFDKSIGISDEYTSAGTMVQADSSQIEQVLLNICINASHSMTLMRKTGERHGGALSVTTDRINGKEMPYMVYTQKKSPEYVTVTISDTGVGMSSETVAKIFDPFFSTKEKGKGTGLGLTMVYGIIHDHGGFIEVYSREGEGSSFTIYLPASHSDTVKIQETDKTIFRGSGNILVVDDEEVMLDVASGMLFECGYMPVCVDNGFTAIDIISSGEPELLLVLLDMAMPGINGRDTFTELKKIKPEIKVIMASGFGRDQRVLESLDSGVDLFIQKPYTIYGLSKAVHDVLAGESTGREQEK